MCQRVTSQEVFETGQGHCRVPARMTTGAAPPPQRLAAVVVWSLLLVPLVRENHFQAPAGAVMMYAALTPRES